MHLLISKDGKYSAERTTADIRDCKCRGNFFSCNCNNVMKKNKKKSCLFALYTNQFEDAMKACQFEVRQPVPILEQIDYNIFLAYTPEPQKATFICKGHQYVATLHDVDLIMLTEGCTIRTGDFYVLQDELFHQTSEDTLLLQEVDWPKVLEFLEEEFSDKERELHERDPGGQREDPPRAHANEERIDKIESPTSNAWTKWGLVAGITPVGIIALLAIMLYCTLQASKVGIKDLPTIIINEGAKHFGLPMQTMQT